MPTQMKRLIYIAAALLLSASAAKADDVPAVVVSTAEGDSAFAISEIRNISHSSGSMLINLAGGEAAVFSLADVSSWKLGRMDTGGSASFSLYDVNRDGEINSSDAVSIYNYISLGEQSGLTLTRVDVNEDGQANTSDVAALYNYIESSSASHNYAGSIKYPSADDLSALYIRMADGQVNIAGLDSLGQISFSTAADTIYIIYNGRTQAMAASDVSVFYYGQALETVSVTYAQDSASVLNPLYFSGVSIRTSGAGVTARSAFDDEVEYTLSGESDNGYFKLYSAKKYQITLQGLTLTNPNGPAINSQTSKRGTIKSQRSYTNTLTDGTAYAASTEDQKGCLFSEGQLIFKGAGTLIVNGLYRHGICSDDYIVVENSDIRVSAKGDALHANDSVSLRGGTLTLTAGGDGIDCEGPITVAMAGNSGTTDLTVTLDSADCAALKSDTLITVSSGNLAVTTTGAAVKAFKSKGNITVSGGDIQITQSGDKLTEDGDASYSTAFKTSGLFLMSGGTVNVNNTADGGKGISSDSEVNITGGDLTIHADGAGGTLENSSSGGGDDDSEKSYRVYVSLPQNGGRGGFGPGGQGNSGAWSSVYLYDSENNQVARLTSTVQLTASSGGNATTFYYYDFGKADSGTYYFKSDDYTARGGGWGGGSSTTYSIVSTTFSGPTSGEDYYFSISNSYTTSSSTRTYQLTNVSSTYGGAGGDASEQDGTSYSATGIKSDSLISISGGTVSIYNKGTMSKSLKGDYSVSISGGTLRLYPSGTMEVISGDATYCSAIKTDYFSGTAGTVNITATGTANRGISADKDLTISGGTYVITNQSGGMTGSSDSYTAKGLTCDGNITLLNGDITVSMSGNGGKGIKSDGAFIVGNSDGSGPALNVSTSGSSYGSSTSTGGGFGPGGWGQQSSGASAKAIKAMGAATINGGQMTISTATDGAEGLESKTSVTINGGRHYFHCYDDCINSNGCIYFLGGVSVCHSTGNDAVDSNAGTAGAITIGDGVVLAYTSNGDPEEGLDCDNNSYIRITGKGIAISAGGSQGGGGGGWGGSSSSSTITNAQQGYAFSTTSVSYTTGRYYTLADSSGNNLVTYSFDQSLTSRLSLFTATGMVSGNTYTVKYSTTEPTDATTAFHGLYLGSTATGTTSVLSFTAQ